MKKFAKANLSRRQFLSGTVALGATTLLPAVSVASTIEKSVEKSAKEEGYRLTKHIADYYKSAAI